jgi:glutaredoxin 3
MSADVVMYRTPACGYCVGAKMLLQKKGVPFREVDVVGDAETRIWLVQVTGKRTVPQIFINGRPVGGYDDLRELDRRGELDRLLAEDPPQPSMAP